MIAVRTTGRMNIESTNDFPGGQALRAIVITDPEFNCISMWEKNFTRVDGSHEICNMIQ